MDPDLVEEWQFLGKRKKDCRLCTEDEIPIKFRETILITYQIY